MVGKCTQKQKTKYTEKIPFHFILHRCIDDIFMTWNHSEQELLQLLEAANKYHPNIKLEYKIGPSLPFLDVFLMNNNGTLLTSVYHKPTAEPYVVPFISDHPRHTALTRAIRYSSTFDAYEKERRHFKLTLLYNRYVSIFRITEDLFQSITSFC